MKKEISIFIIMVCFGLLLGSIHVQQPGRAGEETEMFVNVRNPTEDDIEDVSVKAIFLDLEAYFVTPTMEIDSYENEGVRFFVDIPRYSAKGDHLVKIVASNDDYYDSKYIYMNVI